MRASAITRRPLALTAVLALLAALLIAVPARPAEAADDHLLLTEIAVTPTAGEFVEIHNPTGGAIDLTDYYLTDATFGTGQVYYNITTGVAATAGGGGFGDFHARFPAGSSIASGEYQTISMAGSIGFFATYGSLPTYELFEDDTAPDAVPDMLEALPGTINGQGGLSDSGEFVTIYTWNGTSDLVTDVDYAVWGDQVEAVDKTSVSVDGPDADAIATPYQPDTAIADQDVIDIGSHPGGDSFQRIDLTEGAEVGTGGNGQTGDDETSEDVSTTWGTLAATPGEGVPTGPGIVINEIDYDQDSTDTAEFVELVNASLSPVNMAGYELRFVNGSGAAVYDTIVLPAIELAAGDYFVVCANNATVPNCDLDDSPDTNFIQNGAPDAVALFSGAALVDTVSYEGDTAGFTEGSGSGLVDDPNQTALGISRFPDAADTGQNNVDLSPRCITPGIPNGADNSDCGVAIDIITTFGVCGDPATPIHVIQGAGPSSPVAGAAGAGAVVEGVVVGDFQGATGLGGFFLQEEDGDTDGNDATSEGIFVFDDGFGTDVDLGDVVRVKGDVAEEFGLTQLESITAVSECADQVGGASAAMPTLPVAVDLEAFEGMSVTFAQTLYATDNFSWHRRGEVTLSVGGVLDNPTNVTAPGAAALALADLNRRSQVQLDDGSSVSSPALIPPFISVDGTLRRGDTVDGLTGALGYAFGAYEVHPTAAVSFARVNDRVGPPAVGGSIQVGAFNVLNYFPTIDTGAPICGPGGDQGCRGANSAAELTRQRDKIVDAIVELDAEVLGLMEIENAADNTPEADLVAGLNAIAGAGTYDYIATPGGVGSDAIRVALLYQPGEVTPVGDLAVLDSTVDPSFNDDKNRAVLAQTFVENATGERFTVAVNHLKSKGSDCLDVGDPDAGDGQGNCNGVRTDAAIALVNWLATDPTGSGDSDFLITGDLNSYAQEDPVVAIESGGYSDLIELFEGIEYSFTFFGEGGYLDHALSSVSLTSQVTGAGFWHINADEPSGLDYNQENNQPSLYHPDEWRASDHDPVLVGLELAPVEITPIYEIQGTGPSSPFAEGTVLTTQGVVVGDFQAANERDGFFLQTADEDLAGDIASADSSNGIFINDDGFGVDVAVGDFVQVTGVLDEQFGLTAIDTVSDVTNNGVVGGKTVAPTSVALPFALGGQEAVEGMMVTFTDPIYVTDSFNLGRFGEVVVSQGGPLVIPTNENAPGAAAIAAQDANNANQIILDDGSSDSFSMDPPLHIAPDGTLRRGDSATGVTGVMSFAFSTYRIHPTVPFEFTRDNPREDPEDLGGDVRIASFNLLNFWTTFDDGANDARGADSQAEFDRQLLKTVAAILELDAAVVGLQELENNGSGAIGALVDGLNAATAPGTWAAVPDPAYPGGLESTNAIKVGIIYQTALATPVGPSVADDDVAFATDRPPVAQTFDAAGETFTVIVNHLKSKTPGGETDPGDFDQGDGQGAYNARRTAQALALIDFVAAMQATSGDDDVLVIGDFNSYRLEDPITTLNGAFTNLVESFVDAADQYSLIFFGQQGLLDYAFAAGGITNRITGVDLWHGHTDEPRALDYNDGIQDVGESSASNINPASLYVNDQWRASDHDALVVAFRLTTLREDKELALDAVRNLLPTGTWWGDWRIKRAIYSIEESLKPHLWVDDSHLDPSAGSIVFILEKYAVKSLASVRGAEQPGAEAAIEALVAVDRGLAATLIGEAAAAGANTTRAARYLSQGDSRSRPDRAIDSYRRAWTEATRALGKVEVRFATFNASLNRNNAGQLVTELSVPGSAQPSVIAEIIQRANPDVLLINEFDYDAAGLAAQYFQDNYLSVSQGGADPVDYPYWYVAPSNTGIPSGFDLNNNGSVGGPDDAFGFGFFPGQFGMAVASKYPLDLGDVRTFQNFLWKDMPGALLPEDPPGTPWFTPEELDVVRLSSKSHWDIPVVVGDKTIHFLTSHPTPPVFDGPEDRNGTRNFDEIRFWADYVEGEDYMYDDNGNFGGLHGGARFVIAGDQNSDPLDGDSIPGAVQQLLDSPKVNTSVTPESLGAVEQSALQGGINVTHLSDPRFDTADFSDSAPGNLRADYVLPSKTMTINDAAVFWPEASDPLFALVGTFPFPSSDHRLVWVDVDIARGSGYSWSWGALGHGV